MAFRSAEWALPAKERGRILLRIAQVLRDNKEELAWLDRIAMGKPVSSGRVEIMMAADLFECILHRIPLQCR